jgi:hypothetical protein
MTPESTDGSRNLQSRNFQILSSEGKVGMIPVPLSLYTGDSWGPLWTLFLGLRDEDRVISLLS